MFLSDFVGGNTTLQNVVRGDKITCITNNNSTFPCASQWYHDNYNTCPFSCDEAITAHLLGEYRCRLKCHFRRTDYYFDTMKVVVVETPTPPQTGKFYVTLNKTSIHAVYGERISNCMLTLFS